VKVVATKPPADPDVRRAVRLLAMVHELHKRGYQRLRIVSSLSPSGCYWRCAITSADNLRPASSGPHPEVIDDELAASYSSADGVGYFGWTDAAKDNARQLADKFIARFSRIAAAGLGSDWPYAGWFTELLGRAESGMLPVMYADFELDPMGVALFGAETAR
jgi:hypothetical protein